MSNPLSYTGSTQESTRTEGGPLPEANPKAVGNPDNDDFASEILEDHRIARSLIPEVPIVDIGWRTVCCVFNEVKKKMKYV